MSATQKKSSPRKSRFRTLIMTHTHLVLGDLRLSSGLCSNQAHTQRTYRYVDNTHAHKISLFEYLKLGERFGGVKNPEKKKEGD